MASGGTELHCELSLNCIPQYKMSSQLVLTEFLMEIRLGSGIICQHRLAGKVSFFKSQLCIEPCVQLPLLTTLGELVKHGGFISTGNENFFSLHATPNISCGWS